MVFRPVDGPRVLVAHGSEEIGLQIGSVLLDTGFAPIGAPDGRSALRAFETGTPAAAVLDVALDDGMCFRLIDQMRRHQGPSGVKVVLVASVFNKTAYKRTPTTLHGADDYVEQHHIPDKLPEKLCRLLGLPPPPLAGGRTGRVERIRESEKHSELSGEQRIRALARSIVADIALYSESKLHAAMTSGDPDALQEALDEGRRILAERSGAVELEGRDPIVEAFESLLDDLRRAGG